MSLSSMQRTADEGHAFTSPSVRCPMAQVAAANRHRLADNAANNRQRTRPRVVMQNSFRPSEVMTRCMFTFNRGVLPRFVCMIRIFLSF